MTQRPCAISLQGLGRWLPRFEISFYPFLLPVADYATLRPRLLFEVSAYRVIKATAVDLVH